MTQQDRLFGLEDQLIWLLLGSIGLSLVLLLLVLILWIRISRLRKRYLSSMGTEASVNVEEVLIQLRKQLEQLEEARVAHVEQFRKLEQTLEVMKGRIGFHRYNAFGESGNDLSFSLALLDANRNGVVISSLHNRDMSYVYAKPIVKGDSTYKLTPEERQTIEQADS